MNARGAHASGVECIPLVAAGARPAALLAKRPATERAANTRAGRVEALLLLSLAVQNY